jgi:regulation of enolase protein 1 (concanavalin A-like superfamily)
MELADGEFVAVNVPTTFEQPLDVHDCFSLSAPPNTAIWRVPTALDETTAPMILKRLAGSLILAEVTVTTALTQEFDQAGIVIFLGSLLDPTMSPLPIASRRNPRQQRRGSESRATGRWAKAGLQLVEGELHAASVVAMSPYGADWTSSARIPIPPSPFGGRYPVASQSLRVKIERLDESLWIWYKIPGETYSYEPQSYYPDPRGQRNPEDVASGWVKMREISGFFSGTMEMQKQMWVGCYASRPMDFEPRQSWETPAGLLAEFEDLDIL